MSVHDSTVARWDTLYRDNRHRLKYPSEHVIRWLAGLNLEWPSTQPPSAIDIGCGNGRHTTVLAELGFETFPIDAAPGCLDAATIADMTALPFDSNMFDFALAFGVFYYGSPGDADDAIAEMWRVMKPGGHAFVSYRSVRDWRAKHTNTEGVFEVRGHPEDLMQMDFVNDGELLEMFDAFTDMQYELAEWTTDDRTRMSSEWLVSVVK